MKQKNQIVLHINYLIFNGAVNETRTRDPQLGKLVLYQLSYYRMMCYLEKSLFLNCDAKVNIIFKYQNRNNDLIC